MKAVINKDGHEALSTSADSFSFVDQAHFFYNLDQYWKST